MGNLDIKRKKKKRRRNGKEKKDSQVQTPCGEHRTVKGTEQILGASNLRKYSLSGRDQQLKQIKTVSCQLPSWFWWKTTQVKHNCLEERLGNGAAERRNHALAFQQLSCVTQNALAQSEAGSCWLANRFFWPKRSRLPICPDKFPLWPCSRLFNIYAHEIFAHAVVFSRPFKKKTSKVKCK